MPDPLPTIRELVARLNLRRSLLEGLQRMSGDHPATERKRTILCEEIAALETQLTEALDADGGNREAES